MAEDCESDAASGGDPFGARVDNGHGPAVLQLRVLQVGDGGAGLCGLLGRGMHAIRGKTAEAQLEKPPMNRPHRPRSGELLSTRWESAESNSVAVKAR